MESHGLRDKALKAIDNTDFYPSKGKERIKSMIETRPDWCVSRQRVWGVPLPIFISKKTGDVLVDDEVFENIAIFSNTSSSTKTSPVFFEIKIGSGTPQTLCLDTHQSGLVSIIDFILSFPFEG